MSSVFFSLILSFLALSCSPEKQMDAPLEIQEIAGSTMGTTYSVKYHNIPQGPSYQQIKDEIAKELLSINQQMSTYIQDSNITFFNKSNTVEWVNVPDDFARVVKNALLVAEKSEGFFDPTIYPLVNYWGFGPDKGLRLKDEKKEKKKIEELLKSVGYKNIEARLSPPSLRKKNPLTQIDLSSIAKGYAVDKLASLLRKHQLENYLVEIGGEVKVLGYKDPSKKSPWIIAVETPHNDAHNQQLMKRLDIQGHAIATSGSYRNFIQEKEKSLGHTINPFTGYPQERKLLSVSVIDRECMMADAYATALMSLDSEKAIEWAKKESLMVYMIYREGSDEGKDNQLKEFISPAFRHFILH